MMPFMTQPAVAPACYVPNGGIAQSQIFGEERYLTRTPTVSGDTRKWSWAGWVTPSPTGAFQTVLSAYVNVNNFAFFQFDPAGHLVWYERYANTTYWGWSTKAVYRDTAPFHVVLEYDTAAATPVADRLRIFVNGVRAAVDNTFGRAYGDDWDGIVNRAVEHRIGRDVGSYMDTFNGLMASPAMVSGATPGPVAWGEYNIHGVWVPRPAAEIQAAIAAAGGFGVNGFHLDFSDPLTPGTDTSGQGNHWTAVGFDATGKDSVASTPTKVYATLNPLAPHGSGLMLSQGNTRATTGGVGGPPYSYSIIATMPVCAGKYAWKTKLVSRSATMAGVGLMPADFSIDGASKAAVAGVVLYYDDGKRYVGTSSTAGWGATLAVGDAWVTAFDAATGNVWFGKLTADTGAVGWQGGGDPVAGTNPAATMAASPGGYLPFIDAGQASTLATFEVDFGQHGFVPPTGFLTLCTDNLPEPDIKDPGEAFAQVAATGAGMDSALNALTEHWGGAPHVEIVKRRDASEDWRVRFSDDPGNAWATNNALAKAAAPALAAAGDYVGYRLRVGARYGVWTAEVPHTTGTATTISHGLNTDRAVVTATRVSAGGGDRYIRHPDMTSGHLMVFNGLGGSVADSTLTAFTANGAQINAAAPSGTYRVLVLAERVGFLSLGRYEGNSAENGAFAPLDILPQLTLIMKTSATGGRRVWDAVRSPGNPAALFSALNSAEAESSLYPVDMVVGGVKTRSADNAVNGAGDTYLVVALGRPVGGVCVAPVPAR